MKILQHSKFTLLSNCCICFTKHHLFSRIQNLHFSQTWYVLTPFTSSFSRIQNLHFSQTQSGSQSPCCCLVEFKIYISLKLAEILFYHSFRFVEFKIYISLKLHQKLVVLLKRFVEFKIYISLKQSKWTQSLTTRFVEFKIYISLKHLKF